MANENDLTFGFDTSYFEKGIEAVTKGLTSIQTTTNTVAKGVSKGLTAVGMKFAAAFAGVKAIKSALLDMPEIGQAFGIAKDVFMKNLLFPLRKQVFPLLQKMLDWVRDSRGMFVKWGENLANIFTSVISGVKTAIKFMEVMGSKVIEFTEKLFGKRITGINEIFNLISFKIAALVEFAGVMLGNMGGLFDGFVEGLGDISDPIKNIIDNLSDMLKVFTEANGNGDSLGSLLDTIGINFGKIAGFALDMTDSFIDGFVPAIKDIMTPINGIAEAFGKIFDSIFNTDGTMDNISSTLGTVGKVVGETLVKSFEYIELILLKINEIIPKIKESIDQVTAGFTELGNDIEEKGLWGTIGDSFKAVGNDLFGGKSKRVNDAVIRPNGDVIETNPKDTLVAMKDRGASLSGLGMGGSGSFNINIEPTIIVQQGTVEEGKSVAVGLMDELRTQFNREFERGGY